MRQATRGLKRRIGCFAKSQNGAVTPGRVVLACGFIAVAVALTAYFMGDGESIAAARAQGPSRAELAFAEHHDGASIEDMATAMLVDNYDQDWKLTRVRSIQRLDDGSLNTSLRNWRLRSPRTHPNSQQRIDFEIEVRELEMERRGLTPRL